MDGMERWEGGETCMSRILICQWFAGGDRKWELGVERDEIVLRFAGEK
jgi:hypothetical protein